MNVSVGELEATFKLRDEFSEKIRGLGSTLDKVGKGISSFGTALTVGVTAPLVAIGGAAIKAGMDAVESENLFEVAFGNMADQARAWSETTSDALGLNEYELRRNSATIFTMAESMGLSTKAALSMATGMSELAADMASFFNISSEEAFAKLRSGIVGEAEPLKALGILVDEATAKQAAYTHGIVRQGAELTQQQKVQARWAAILDQTSKAQGDLARTIDSPTNQLRIMRARIEEATTSLGVAMLPALKSVTDFLARMVPKIEAAVKWFADLPEPTRNWAIGLLAVSAAAGPVLLVIGNVIGSISKMTQGVTALKLALSGLNLTPLGLALTAISVAAGLAVDEMNKLEDASGKELTWREKLAALIDRGVQAQRNQFLITGDFREALRSQAGEAAYLSGALTDATKAVDGLTSGIRPLPPVVNSAAKAMKEFDEAAKQKRAAEIQQRTEELEAYTKAVSALSDELSGASMAQELRKIDDAIAMASRSGGIASAQFFELGKKLQDLEDKGGKLSAQQQGIARSYTLLQVATGAYAFSVGTAAQAVESLTQKSAALVGPMLANISTWREGVTQLRALSVAQQQVNAKALFDATQLAAQRAWSAGLGVARDLTTQIGHAMTGAGNVIMSVVSSAIGIVQQYIASARAAGAATAAIAGFATLGISAVISLFTAGLQRTREMRAEVASLQEQIRKLGATPLPIADILAKLPGVTGLAKTSIELLRKQLDELTKAQNALNEAMSRAGLSLDDIGTAAEKNARRLAQFLDDAKRLLQAGFSIDQVVRGNSAALNALLKHAIETGQKLPASMRPYIEELIRSGGLTDELKRKLLGLADPVPWQEMEAAAARYGLSIDALGVKFEQAKLDDAIKQIVKDWELLSKNGADVNAVMAAMKDEVQALITKALRLGLTIPESMRPLIEAMIKAGELTDENGDKLTDLTKLKFAEDLESDFDKLIRKLDEFIERLIRAGGALEDWPDPGDSFPPLPPVIPPTGPPPIPPSEEQQSAMAAAASKAVDIMKAAASTMGVPSGAKPSKVTTLDAMAKPATGGLINVTIDARGAVLPDEFAMRKFAKDLVPMFAKEINRLGFA